MMITKIRRNAKALSPIFAVLILIAIAVIAGIVVYMFTSGTIATLTGGGTAAQEKAAVQGVDVQGTSLYVYASSVAGGDIDITGAIVKDSLGSTVAVDNAPTGGPLGADGSLTEIIVALGGAALDSTETYTVTLTSAKGGSFVSASFKP
jgi:flagellin-like protein